MFPALTEPHTLVGLLVPQCVQAWWKASCQMLPKWKKKAHHIVRVENSSRRGVGVLKETGFFFFFPFPETRGDTQNPGAHAMLEGGRDNVTLRLRCSFCVKDQ